MVSEWSRGLAGMSPAQISRGLEEWRGDWPPTLPEFISACGGKKSGKNEYGLDHVPEYYRPQPIRDKAKLLSSDERDARRAKAKEKLDQLRQSAFGGDKKHD